MELTELQQMPEEVQEIIAKHSEDWEDDYEHCRKLNEDLNAVGWEADYDLSASVFDISPVDSESVEAGAEEDAGGGKKIL